MENQIIEKPKTEISQWKREEIDLIKDTVAKGATDNELKLFLYRCKNLQLDPLKPGMIHFIKYGNNPGTIVIGIDGMRSRAQSTGKMKGAKTGIIRASNGACMGAWAEIYRSDWDHPARAEVSLREYATDHRPWQRMPETMIKKVAEMHALRMAFPNELGGLYGHEEMDQAKPVVSVMPTKVETLVTLAKKEAK